MKIQKFGYSMLLSVSLVMIATVPPSATAGPIVTQQELQCPTKEPPNPDPRYLCRDKRLGPAALPTTGPVAALLKGYQRFGSLTPEAFLKEYRRADDKGWTFPGPKEDRGFQVINGKRLRWKATLDKGLLLDRFGDVKGSFLAPAGTPFAHRSMPPDALNNATNDYHCYEVVKSFSAYTGPTAPWHAQGGYGPQVYLDPKLVNSDKKKIDVEWLIDGGYITEPRDAKRCVKRG